MGESRWQVHGSTLLTDRAGASGVVHNNTQRPSLPFPLFRRSIYITPPKPIFNTHPHEQFLPPFPDINVYTARLHREPFGVLTFSPALSVSPSLVPLSLPFSLSLLFLLGLRMHLYCLISLRSLLLPQHSCTCPLTGPPSFFGSYTLHQSFLFLYLFSPFSSSPTDWKPRVSRASCCAFCGDDVIQ